MSLGPTSSPSAIDHRPSTISPRVIEIFEQAAAESLAPPPQLQLADWAERNFVFSPEDSVESGSYYNIDRAPFQRGPLNAITQRRTKRVVLWTASQMMKTLILKIALSYFIKEDPSPILMVLPTLDVARRVSKQRLAPMFRDMPILKGMLAEGAKKGSNAILDKSFDSGAVLFMVGANAPRSLASMPMRILVADEIDGFPLSAGAEGDPIWLVRKRLTTYWNAIELLASSCTNEGESRIIGEYNESNRQKYWVPCPQCGDMQLLEWGRLSCPKDDTPFTLDNVVYACKLNGCVITEFDKRKMLAGGEWRAERPEIETVQGFWISEMYSPFKTWPQMAEEFVRATKERHNPELLRVFVNTSLAEPWKPKQEEVEAGDLIGRREEYSSPVPDGVTVITAAVDVQQEPMRLEIEVVGWGRGQESWSLDRLRFEGDVTSLNGRNVARADQSIYEPSAWEKLEDFLKTARYLHQRGLRLDVACCFVDSGYQAQTVYQFTRHMQKQDLRVFACKGVGGWGHPPLKEWNRNNKPKVRLYPVGVDVLKKLVYARLRLGAAGAGYCHFSRGSSPTFPDRPINDANYFAELTVEKLKRRYVHGFPQSYWSKPEGAPNESLDLRVYATAALLSLSKDVDRMLEGLRAQLVERAKAVRARVAPDNQLDLLRAVGPMESSPEPSTQHPEPEAPSSQPLAASSSPVQASAPKPPPEPAKTEEPPPEPPKPRVSVRLRWR